ncbi:hypothetical protein E2562_020068 [Oryza meyeriana var. granulata]|uniref:Uncharacterized protein n=1 Tax=Oryza meyeriana var. granulata TaxID=110450 RepID=A0A6G1BX95_9ORYZ|nr:hypothetical protein E2562_020068 [Oryza meyeriana var. granulata]
MAMSMLLCRKRKKRLAAKETEVQEAKGALDAKLMTIGNIVHQSVPVSDDEVTANPIFAGADVAEWKGLLFKG